MNNYKIADICINIQGEVGPFLKEHLAEYKVDCTDSIDITICNMNADSILLPDGQFYRGNFRWNWILPKSGGYAAFQRYPLGQDVVSLFEADKDWKDIRLKLKHVENRVGATVDSRSYVAIGEIFAYSLFKREGIALHSSAIAYNNEAILFSAPSGTGKSTHTALWKKYYNAVIFNDDFPAIRFIDARAYAYGTPWSGKSKINCNMRVPIKAIVFIERAQKPTIRPISRVEAIGRIMSEVRKPVFPEMMEECLNIIGRLVENVAFYVLSCDISKDAVDLVRETCL
ncbi:MAG: hypothetical protein PHF89_05570 [Eubacteriales bacterium]|nr:hypothetical protein [Eubacteriales bacterium]